MKFVFFSVSENGENRLGDKGADGVNAPPQNFWARTARGGFTKQITTVTMFFSMW